MGKRRLTKFELLDDISHSHDTVARLMNSTGLSEPHVRRRLSELEATGYIHQAGEERNSGLGRNPVRWRVGREAWKLLDQWQDLQRGCASLERRAAHRRSR